MIDSVSEHAGGGPDFKKSRRPKTLSERGAATLDRLPPHDLQMEMGVLGCIMLSPNECLGECVEKLKDDGKEAFYDLRHQTIYETLSNMFNARQPIDLITVQQNLKERQLLEQVGGIPYLSQIQDGVPSAANLSWYLEKVKEKYLLRRMIQTCTGVVGRIYEYEGEVDQLLDEVEKEVLRVNESRVQTNVQGVKDLVNHAITTIEHFFNRKGELSGLPTGFPDLDRMTDGLHGGEMIVIAARPSMGKTSLA
ncbi:MAG TPA: DnaB-like helicase N-terminal domain-containing protein, partial [Candidatus Acidoferrales bacterium]|nr:DnaB-like helicase N-terminal domain-containing protein [Candidatus Acidoferrales bacterium]